MSKGFENTAIPIDKVDEALETFPSPKSFAANSPFHSAKFLGRPTFGRGTFILVLSSIIWLIKQSLPEELRITVEYIKLCIRPVYRLFREKALSTFKSLESIFKTGVISNHLSLISRRFKFKSFFLGFLLKVNFILNLNWNISKSFESHLKNGKKQ